MYEKELLIDAYRKMATIRAFETKAEYLVMHKLVPGPAHLYIGEEACGVGVCENLNDDDYIESTHRGQTLKSFYVTLPDGSHNVTIKALDDNVMIDQWVLDYALFRVLYHVLVEVTFVILRPGRGNA